MTAPLKCVKMKLNCMKINVEIRKFHLLIENAGSSSFNTASGNNSIPLEDCVGIDGFADETPTLENGTGME